jgi:hypothetical protein
MKLFNRNNTPTPSVAPTELPPVTSIGELEPRALVDIRGTVVRIRTIPRTGLPSLAATIEDETGKVVAIWSGRRAIGGVTLGRRIELHGIAVKGRHELEFHNPEYTLR